MIYTPQETARIDLLMSEMTKQHDNLNRQKGNISAVKEAQLKQQLIATYRQLEAALDKKQLEQ